MIEHVHCSPTSLPPYNQEGGIERQFEVTQTGMVRQVCHLQYSAWPHHGTPEDPGQFANFIRLLSDKRKLVETPVLVHCR